MDPPFHPNGAFDFAFPPPPTSSAPQDHHSLAAFDPAGFAGGHQGGAGAPGGGAGDTGLSQDDLVWLEQQLSLAAAHASPPPAPSAYPALDSPNGGEVYPHQPHAFPPVSAARFHPYQLPPDRAQRLRPPGPSAQLNLVQPPHLQHAHGAYSSAPANGALDALHWPSFGSFAPSFAPVAAPPPHPPLPAPQAQHHHTSAPFAHSGAKPLGAVLYPPQDSPSPLLLPDEPTPTYPPAPHASPATPSTLPTPSAAAGALRSSPFPSSPLANGAPVPSASSAPRATRPRARSAPPPPAPSPAFRSSAPAAAPKKAHQLSELFSWLDAQRWSFGALFGALSDPEGTPAPLGSEHGRRLGEFLAMDEPLASGGVEGETDGARVLQEAKRRWALRRRQEKGKGREGEGEEDVEERGPDEVVRMWEELGGLGRKREGTMANAVRELHSNVHDGAVPGSIIRRIINRYGEAYKESSSDIKRLDAALARPPSPHLTSAPREASVWTGTLVIPPTQADVLQAWLMSPGRPGLGDDRGRIDPEHMRVYSSLSPLDLHARGAELCRVILLRDAECMRLYGHHFDRLQAFKVGPLIAPLDTCGFASYDEQSLWHHALQTYLQLCVRYPAFRDSKDATITILPDLPPPVHPTALETVLIDRALRDHWEHLRVFLLEEHGGLLRSAVRAFTGVKLSRFDLLSVCDDTRAVMLALARSKKNPSERFLAYDPAISQIRNAWRQQAYYDKTADLVVWSAATTHFLEISALHPDFALGVTNLPGLEALLGKTAPNGTTAMQH
ncbi:hypothetical protein JCM10450v2_000855 [Rhodotorula kratochvilovae]